MNFNENYFDEYHSDDNNDIDYKLYHNSHEFNEVVKEVVKENPFRFLYYYSDKTWAQPYIDEAAKRVAKEYPEFFLEKWTNRFPQYINTALFALGSENVTK